eukprot:TRINITY_DN3951_c0_g1_i2.p1 TRINITY_DN3951_c0_g1~~TRINITY_DN3951_c0_g1_i2.p1  ORF type:complete len:116 (+),score=24.53 TRINITY_DN3951_c0_g1_i2:178-525(+)
MISLGAEYKINALELLSAGGIKKDKTGSTIGSSGTLTFIFIPSSFLFCSSSGSSSSASNRLADKDLLDWLEVNIFCGGVDGAENRELEEKLVGKGEVEKDGGDDGVGFCRAAFCC